jgi:hypothetical protein
VVELIDDVGHGECSKKKGASHCRPAPSHKEVLC